MGNLTLPLREGRKRPLTFSPSASDGEGEGKEEEEEEKEHA